MRTKTGSQQQKLKKAGKIFFVVIIILFTCFPIYIAILTSLKTESEVSKSILGFPATLQLENYRIAMEKSSFVRSLINSCVITFPSVALIVICSAMCGYSIARHSKNNRYFYCLDKVYLASLMIPFQILMIPVYKMFKSMDMLNSRVGMILILTGTSVAYATFLYVGFVKSIPRELEEAAMIDGCGPYKTFFKIIFPLLKPITATVATLHVMWLWNDFNIALILLQKEEVRTLTVKQYYFFGEHATDYGVAFAASILCMIPVLIFFISSQRYLVEGIAAGAVKS